MFIFRICPGCGNKFITLIHVDKETDKAHQHCAVCGNKYVDGILTGND